MEALHLRSWHCEDLLPTQRYAAWSPMTSRDACCRHRRPPHQWHKGFRGCEVSQTSVHKFVPAGGSQVQLFLATQCRHPTTAIPVRPGHRPCEHEKRRQDVVRPRQIRSRPIRPTIGTGQGFFSVRLADPRDLRGGNDPSQRPARLCDARPPGERAQTLVEYPPRELERRVLDGC